LMRRHRHCPRAGNRYSFSCSAGYHWGMGLTDDEIRERLLIGEDSDCGFKEIRFRGNEPEEQGHDALADEIAAFANADGGQLLCSVTGSGEVVGMSREEMDGLERLIVEVCTNSIKPALRIYTHKRLHGGEAGLLVVKIPRGETLYGSPGGHYLRMGSSKIEMSPEEQLLLNQRRSHARCLRFDMQPVPDTGFGTLDENLWKPLLGVDGQEDPEAALEQLRLLAGMRQAP